NFGQLRHYVPQDILDVSFPVSVRGYERRAVDAYTERVNRVIAELKVSASPPAAVRHALEQAEEKVQGLLHAAREAAEELTARLREIGADTEAVWKERRELLDDIGGIARRLVDAANAAAGRFRARGLPSRRRRCWRPRRKLKPSQRRSRRRSPLRLRLPWCPK